jgi:hypothetical protein
MTVKAKWQESVGKRYGRLVVIDRAGLTTDNHVKVLCRCDCGQTKVLTLQEIRRGNTKSCGCYMKEEAGKRFRTHGASTTPTYKSWNGMVNRCLNPRDDHFPDYGGRGIKVCDRWLIYENFLADMGERPVGKTIDRKDNNGNYEPGNCKWSTMKEQARNRRANVFLEFQGKRQPVSAWAEEIGIDIPTLWCRIFKLNWSVQKALTTSVRKQITRRG